MCILFGRRHRLTIGSMNTVNDIEVSPADAGFYMPGEWQPHERCWMAWPPGRPEYANNDAMRSAYADVAKAIARFEPVTMIANKNDVVDAVQRCGTSVDVVPWSLDDAWSRDSGPTYLVDDNGGIAGVDWKFNCWGKLTPSYAEDAAMAERILARTATRRFAAPIYLEGGGIHTDGEGTLLTTENVVLNPNRNPELTSTAADEIFTNFLGSQKVFWLEHVMEYDDTDGHIDNLVCFARPGMVLALAESNRDDAHYQPMQNNLQRLRAARDAQGRALDIIEIHQPQRREYRGKRLPLSYINFYIANGGIIMPKFDEPTDEPARDALAEVFPEHEIVQVAGVEIVKGGGCLHCITQQQPKV